MSNYNRNSNVSVLISERFNNWIKVFESFKMHKSSVLYKTNLLKNYFIKTYAQISYSHKKKNLD